MITLILAQASPASAAADASAQQSFLASSTLAPFAARISKTIADAIGISPDIVQPIILLAIKFVLAVLLLAVAWMVAGWSKKAMQRIFARTDLDETLERFFANAIRWVVLAVGVIICLEAFGVSATSLVAVLGTVGLAIGLALQGSLSHFASGIMLLIFRPFKVDDVVNVAGKEGKVDAIDLFTTTIDTADNRRIIIPNGQIFGTVIENHTFHERRMVSVRVTAAGDADAATVRSTLVAAAKRAIASTPAGLAEPAPTAVLIEIGGPQVWETRVWCRPGQLEAMREVLWSACKGAIESAALAPAPGVQLVRQLTS